MSIHLIWAQGNNGIIGRDGQLPWHLPEDLQHFKTLTAGKTVLMGSKTWLSLPESRRPLPGRRNVVLSKRGLPGTQVEVYASLPAAIDALDGSDIWVIGGAAVYRATMPLATHLHVTHVNLNPTGDVLAPIIDYPRWQVNQINTTGWQTATNGLGYRFTELNRLG